MFYNGDSSVRWSEAFSLLFTDHPRTRTLWQGKTWNEFKTTFLQGLRIFSNWSEVYPPCQVLRPNDLAGRDYGWFLNGSDCPTNRKSVSCHASGIELAELQESYFVFLGCLSCFAVLLLISEIHRLFSIQELVNTPVCQTSEYAMLEWVLYVSGRVKLLPHPRVFHVALVLLNYFWMFLCSGWR